MEIMSLGTEGMHADFMFSESELTELLGCLESQEGGPVGGPFQQPGPYQAFPLQFQPHVPVRWASASSRWLRL